MRIKVKLRATGEVAEIEETEFSDELHERVAEDEGVNIRELVDAIAENHRTLGRTVSEAIASALSDAGLGRVEGRPAHMPADADDARADRAPAGGHLRARPAVQALYDGLPEHERAYRTPESDALVAQFLRGVALGNDALVRDAISRDSGLDPEVRKRALAEGTTAAGGALVPSPLANLLVAKLQKEAAIGPRAMTFTSSADTLDVPAENAVMVASGVAENAVATESDPSMANVRLTKKKAIAATRSSIELTEDSAFSLISILSRQASAAFAVYNDTQDVTGDGAGTNQTDGLDNNSSVPVVNATVGALSYTAFTAVFYALPSQYRRGAVWTLSNAMIQKAAEELDANGRPIFAAATAAGTPISGGQGAPGVGAILGLTVVECPMPDDTIMLGDLSYFGALEGGGIRVESSRDVAFLADQIVWKFVQRRDGAVLMADAFRKSTGVA